MPSRDFPVIDSHTHIFPEKIAVRAVGGISGFYGLPMAMSGTSANLLGIAREAGTARLLVTSTATKKDQVRAINRFLKAETDAHPEFFAFGTLHQDMTGDETAAEMDRMERDGFKGIKLHPDFQGIRADSPGILGIARRAAGRFPILIHAGDPRYDFSNPDRIRGLLENSPPDLVLIAAHLGGWKVWDEAVKKLSGYPNLYVDTCSSLSFLTAGEASDILRAYGTDKVLFGSDFPMWDMRSELGLIGRLGLGADDLLRILHDNAATLFGI